VPLRPRLTSGNRSSSKAVQIQTPAGDTERMDESDQDRRVRVVVDVTRRPPTDDERERRAEAVRRTPNAIGGPFEAVWSWSVSFEDPSGSHVAGGGTMQSAADERLEEIVSRVRHTVSVELARRLARDQIPIDRRFAELIGTDHGPTRSEVATRTCELLGLPKPTRDATVALVVELVLVAHGWYDNNYAPSDSTEVGHSIVSAAQHRLSAEDFQAALGDLELEDDVQLWSVAAGLVKQMGLRIS